VEQEGVRNDLVGAGRMEPSRSRPAPGRRVDPVLLEEQLSLAREKSVDFGLGDAPDDYANLLLNVG